jgi:hypothetical protein
MNNTPSVALTAVSSIAKERKLGTDGKGTALLGVRLP